MFSGPELTRNLYNLNLREVASKIKDTTIGTASKIMETYGNFGHRYPFTSVAFKTHYVPIYGLGAVLFGGYLSTGSFSSSIELVKRPLLDILIKMEIGATAFTTLIFFLERRINQEEE